jgi:integrase
LEGAPVSCLGREHHGHGDNGPFGEGVFGEAEAKSEGEVMACKVKVNRHGRLAFRLFWDGQESWEGTRWKDTPKNRIKAEADALRISEEMERGTFDYLKWFPNGNREDEFRPKPKTLNVDAIPKTVRQYYEEWIKGKKPPLVRKSRERDYRQAFNKHILPFLGDIPVDQITPRKLEDFRINLLEQAKLSLKSARNIIDAYLRAMMRDARNVDHLTREDPFTPLEWKKQPKEEPDPFTEEERDKILEFYRESRPYKAYVFVHNQFWTGMRPSEATALRRGKVDLTSGKAMIVRSRHLGAEDAPKTRASRRTVKLLPNVVELLDAIIPLHQAPDDYVYTDEQGRAIDQAEFGRDFQGVLRLLKIRPRPFYNTRHTYISVALTLGCNIKWIAEQCGTSVEMIQENYGKYIRSDGDAPMLAYLAKQKEDQEKVTNEAETETLGETFSDEGAKSAENMVVPTGFEPVLPT